MWAGGGIVERMISALLVVSCLGAAAEAMQSAVARVCLCLSGSISHVWSLDLIGLTLKA